MRPFDLEAARRGEPICTRDGNMARLLTEILNNKDYPIVVAVTRQGGCEEVEQYPCDGIFPCIQSPSENDLMMVKDKAPKRYINAFNIELAKKGVPVCTLGGRPARIICYDMKDGFRRNPFHIGVLIDINGKEEIFRAYDENGICFGNRICENESLNNLRMAVTKKGGIR
jgi:hypothetical protein